MFYVMDVNKLIDAGCGLVSNQLSVSIPFDIFLATRYVRVSTNLGDLNLELHCDVVPRTCENFLALCAMGYYTGTKFHRSIKNFMIQVQVPPAFAHTGEKAVCCCFSKICGSFMI